MYSNLGKITVPSQHRRLQSSQGWAKLISDVLYTPDGIHYDTWEHTDRNNN
jgi:hypothetical protein